MSTQICTLHKTGNRHVKMTIARYYGGLSVGPCLQLSASMENGEMGYVQLSNQDIVRIGHCAIELKIQTQ